MAAPAAAAAHQLALTSASPSQTSCTETNTLQAPPQGNPKVLPEVGEIHNPFRKFWLYRRVLSQLNMPGKALWDLRGKHLNRLSEPPRLTALDAEDQQLNSRTEIPLQQVQEFQEL